jgi:PKD domain
MAALILAACAVSAEEARAAAWLPPVELGSSGNLAAEQAVVTSQGEMVAAWIVFSATGSKIQTTVRPAGGSFSPPADLIPFVKGVENLDLTTDPAGNSIATWRGTVDPIKDDIRLYYSYRPPGGAFTAPQEVTGAGIHVAQPTTAMDTAGNALTAFVRNPGGDGHLAYVFRPAGGEYGEQHEITSFSVGNPKVEFTSDGTAIAAWPAVIAGTVQASRRPPGGDFGAIEPVSASGVLTVREAVAAGGRAVLAWQRYNGSDNIVEAALAESGGEFGAPIPLSTPGFESGFPVAAINPTGNAFVAWRDGGAGDFIRAAVAAPGGAFAAAAPPASAKGFGGEAQFADDGSMMLVWQQGDNDPNPAQAALRSAAGVFGPTTVFTPPGQDTSALDLSGDGRGNFLVLHSYKEGPAQETLRAVGYDGVPPAFRSLSVPAKARTGKAVTFSADVFDVWGASVAWNFGDGRSASGAAVKHTYRKTGGRRTIVVTATDPAGQSSTERRTLNVKDVTPVVISRARFRPPAFAAKGSAAHSARARKGSTLRFRLSEPARVRIAFERMRKRGGKTRYIRLRSKPLKRKGKKGGNRVRFSGRLGGARLSPGRYRAALVATDTGGLKSKTKYARFTIVGP